MYPKRSISFVMPMFNESENIVRTITSVSEIARAIADEYELVIVDDASTDGCGDIAMSIAEKDPSIKVIKLPHNTRFGGAFAKAFKNATKEVVLYMDSDMPVSTEDITKSLPLIDEADIVTGYSTVKKGDNLIRKVMSGVYNFMVQMFFGLNVRDINSGYKIVRKDLIADIDFISRSPFVDVELFLQAKKKKGRVKQYPLIFLQREGGKSYMSHIPMILATFRDMIKVWIKEITNK